MATTARETIIVDAPFETAVGAVRWVLEDLELTITHLDARTGTATAAIKQKFGGPTQDLSISVAPAGNGRCAVSLESSSRNPGAIAQDFGINARNLRTLVQELGKLVRIVPADAAPAAPLPTPREVTSASPVAAAPAVAAVPQQRASAEPAQEWWEADAAATTYPTPFQFGGLLRSCALGFVAVGGFSGVVSPEASAGEAALAFLFGSAFAGLVLYRLVGSNFYLRYPLGGWGKAAMVTHDILGSVVLWLMLAVVLLVTFVLTFFGIPFFWWLTALLGVGSKSTLNRNGVVYKRNMLTGNWEAEVGLFGPKTDKGLFGPNVEHGFFGDATKEEGAVGVHGEQLYQRRS